MCKTSGFHGEESLKEMFCYSGALFNKFLEEFLELLCTGSVEITLNSSFPGNSEPKVWPVTTKVYSKGSWSSPCPTKHIAHCPPGDSYGREPSS